jgi:hypothetical protein
MDEVKNLWNEVSELKLPDSGPNWKMSAKTSQKLGEVVLPSGTFNILTDEGIVSPGWRICRIHGIVKGVPILTLQQGSHFVDFPINILVHWQPLVRKS